MSEENRDTEPVETGSATPPSVGSQLKAARESRQMSVADVALALKLGAKQVEALENGNWQSLPGQTFIRGFVRNYARMLQLDPTPLMAQLDAVLESPQLRLSLPGQPKRQVTMPQTGASRRRDFAMAWAGLGLVAVAAGIYFLLPEDLSEVRRGVESTLSIFSRKEEAPPAAAPAQSEPVFPPGTTPQQVMNPQAAPSGEPAPANPPSPSALVPPPVLQGSKAPESAAKPQATPAAPAPAKGAEAPAAADVAAPLHFAFRQDSWVQVRDGKGRVVFAQIGKGGTEQNVAGEAPFTVVIGNAPAVKLSLRGKPVDLAPRTQGNVARLTLE